jgi:bifunctional UDP-N-acetylglucosamine pyrophosphorylase/glucosamine-1-phosphate N-acetyltransferase
LNKKILELLNELKQKMQKENEFEFWNYLNESEKLMQELEEEVLGEIEANVAIKGKLFLGKNSLIKSGTRIEGNVLIGENCVIGPNAFLRNGTILAEKVKVGMSEIKNSIILSNSNIPHFNYVGDSILGENINLGAGTKIANLRFDDENIKVELNGKKTDSGRRKLGALIGNNVKTGINSGINCGVIVKKNSFILPNELKQ